MAYTKMAAHYRGGATFNYFNIKNKGSYYSSRGYPLCLFTKLVEIYNLRRD